MPSPPSLRLVLGSVAPILALALALGCGGESAPRPPDRAGEESAPRPPDRALVVVASVEPLSMLVRELAGPRAAVHTLLPPGASPHFFAPRPSALRAAARADWVLRIGGRFDGWAQDLLALGGADPLETELLALPGLDPLPLQRAHDHGHEGDTRRPGGADTAGLDPHCWLDPIRVRDAVVPALVAALVALDPDGDASYRAAAERFRRELDRLDAELRTLFAPPEPAFLSLHAAWGYLAARYGLRALGVVEVLPGEAPSPRHLAALVRESKRHAGRLLLVEPTHHSPAARVVAEALGAETRLVDPLGDPRAAPRADYTSLMRFNARAIATAGGRSARNGD